MLVLGIETSCDETACAVVRDGKEILSSIITSSIDLHRPFNGVVPELACRRHAEVFLPVLEEALEKASCSLEEIDLIAVAQGPGLVGALLLGVNAAKALSLALEKPFIGVNHVQAHLYAPILGHVERIEWPAVGLVVSGGHTALCRMQGVAQHTLISSTVDDALGEAFDKVAVLLGLGYPGGPQVEQLAKEGSSSRFHLSPGRVKGSPLAFSFSGLKTAVLYAAREASSSEEPSLSDQDRADLAAAFQEVALADIVRKTMLACQQVGARSLILGGGVTANQALRALLLEAAGDLPVFWPGPGLSTDNAAMIAGLGYHLYQKQQRSSPFDLEAFPQMPWCQD